MESIKFMTPGIRRTIILTELIIAGICMTGCYNPDRPVNSPANSGKFSKTLLVIGDDRSGSTSDIRKFNKEDYRILFEKVGSKGGGAVAVCLIGNPSPQKREPYTIGLKSLENIETYDPKDPGLTLTQKGNLKAKNENINGQNEATLKEQRNNIEAFIAKFLEPNVINYLPSGPDDTDLDDAIDRINTLIHEPQYEYFDNTIIVFISDGKNESHNHKRPITNKLTAPNAEIYLVGWETETACFTGRNIHKMSSKDGFIEIIKNLK